MAQNLGEAVLELRTDESGLTGGLRRAEGGLGRFGGVVGLAGAAGVAAVASIGIASLNMAQDFETAFAEVTTLFDAPQRQVDALKRGVIDLSNEMGISATDAAGALYQAISAGVPPENAIDFLRSNTQFAVAGVTDLTTAVDLTTTVMNAWGLASNELGRVQDVLFSGVRAGKTTVEELGQSIFQVAPAASAAGVSIEEVTAGLATLTASGVPTSVAATQMRQAIIELGREGTSAGDAFERVAGVSFRDFIAAGGDMTTAMDILNRAAADSGVAVGDLFGSVEAGQAVTVLAGEGLETFAGNLEGARNSAGLTDTAFERMNETFGRQWAILSTQLKNILLEIGLAVLPTLIDVMERLNPWLQEHIPLAIAFMQEKWVELQPHIEEFGRILRDDVLPIIQRFGDLIQTVWPIVSNVIIPAIQDWLRYIGDLLTLLGDVISFVTNVFQGDWEEAWQDIKDIAEGILNLFLDYLQLGFLDEIFGMLTDAVPTMLQKGRDLFQGLYDGLVGFWTDTALPWVRGLAQLIFDTIGDVLETLKQKGIDLLQGLWDGFREHWVTVVLILFGGVPGLILAVLEEYGLGPTFLFQKGRELLQGLWDGLTDLWTTFSAALAALPALIFSTIGNVTRTLWDKGRDLLQGLWDGLIDLWLTGLRLWYVELPTLIFNTIGNVLRTLYYKGWDLLQGLWQGMADRGSSLITWIRGIPGAILEAIGDLGRLLYNAGRQIVQSLIDGINSLIGMIPDLTPGFDIPGVPFFHSGGVVPGLPGQNVLGVLKAGEIIVPTDFAGDLRGLIAGRGVGRDGAGVTQHITVNAPDSTPSVIAHAVRMASLRLADELAFEGAR